jgi:nucleoid-associated protein YgaU
VTGEETLWLIADEEYGDPSKWRRIAEANDLENPRDLRSGQRLVVPEL